MERLRKAQFPSIKVVAMLSKSHEFPKFNLIWGYGLPSDKGLNRPQVHAKNVNASMDND